MRVALNGYFWGQPRTGSGQYLRHLWSAFSDLTPPTESPGSQRFPGESDMVLMLMPVGGNFKTGDKHLQTAILEPKPLAPVQKFAWENWGVMSRAVRQRADLLHVPYLSAPWAKRVPVVVTAHDMIPWVLPGYEGSPAVRIYLMLAALAVKRADLIIADSDASRRDVIRVLKVPSSRV